MAALPAIVERRLQQGGAAILRPTNAAEMLPVRKEDGLRWLRERGLIRSIAGLGDVVVWGDVVAAILAGDEPQRQDVTPASRRGGTLRRGRL